MPSPSSWPRLSLAIVEAPEPETYEEFCQQFHRVSHQLTSLKKRTPLVWLIDNSRFPPIQQHRQITLRTSRTIGSLRETSDEPNGSPKERWRRTVLSVAVHLILDIPSIDGRTTHPVPVVDTGPTLTGGIHDLLCRGACYRANANHSTHWVATTVPWLPDIISPLPLPPLFLFFSLLFLPHSPCCCREKTSDKQV